MNVVSPITQKTIYTIEEASDNQIKEVYQNAKKTQSVIESFSVTERVHEILKLRDYIIENRESIIDRIVEETGKSRLDALTSEIFEVCDVIDVFRKKAPKILADKSVDTPIVLMGKKSKIVYNPLGTILVIPPWNYPFYQCMVPAILSFLAGNATIIKPSEVTPLKGLIEEIISKNGFIENAIQVVYGSGVTGSKLIAEKPNKIHFTGSGKTGRKIMAQAAEMLIPVDLELGGKDPALVFEDVNLERTVNGVLWGAFTNAGQSCTSIERCYVHESIFDEFVNSLTQKANKLRVSTPNRNIKNVSDCDLGCTTTPFQLKIIQEHIEDAVNKGAKVLCGGKSESNHFPPTVLVNVNHSMKIMQEETFGPVLPIMKFKTEEEVVDLANDSVYGLSASIWSKDLQRANRVMRKLQVGNVSINNHMLTEANPNLPFGGTKESGFGRIKGEEGLVAFTNSKSVLIDKQSDLIEPHWYPFTETKYKLISSIITSFFSKKKNWLKFAQTGLQLDSIGKKEKIK